MHICIQRKLEEEVNELTSKLTTRETDIKRLQDDIVLLLQEISERKEYITELEAKIV